MLSPYSALLELSTHTVLTVSHYPPAIVFLAEGIPNAYAYHAINLPNYKDSFPLANTRNDEYVLWSWEPKKKVFFSTPPANLDDALRYKSQLASAKRDGISYIMDSIGRLREKVGTGIKFQETIYILKRLQAEGFRDAGYPENNLVDYPFVVQYADQAGISLKVAADDIIYKARIDDGILANTETLRIKFFGAMRDATTLEEVAHVVKSYSKYRSADL